MLSIGPGQEEERRGTTHRENAFPMPFILFYGALLRTASMWRVTEARSAWVARAAQEGEAEGDGAVRE